MREAKQFGRITVFGVMLLLGTAGCASEPPVEAASVTMYLAWRLGGSLPSGPPALVGRSPNIAIVTEDADPAGRQQNTVIATELRRIPGLFGRIGQLKAVDQSVAESVARETDAAKGRSSVTFERLRTEASREGYDLIITCSARSSGGLAVAGEAATESQTGEATVALADVTSGQPIAIAGAKFRTLTALSIYPDEADDPAHEAAEDARLLAELVKRVTRPLLQRRDQGRKP